jgi:hypothetical protein
MSSGMASHPRLHARGTPRGAMPSGSDELLRVLVYAPDPQTDQWIDFELRKERVVVQLARSVAEIVSALVDDPPPRPQILVADFDFMTAGELLHLHSVREHGWFGNVIALGCVPLTLRLSMRIERVLSAPYARDTLRAIIAHAAQMATCTIKMPKITG